MRISGPNTGPTTTPTLRLVSDRAASASRPAATRGVEAENRRSVTLSALDPRWVLAVQVKRAIEGGRAAVLPPEARERLIALGGRLGLRPFDTSLVIAVVQDGARESDDALAPDVIARLELVGGGRNMPDVLTRQRRRAPMWVFMVCAAIAGSVLTLLLLRMFGRL
ncbi:MAG: hypothetical protein K2W85_05715 [Phycisphaerales bacterium]|nr:hypothetical protein [Phycisphaerales bacterium]